MKYSIVILFAIAVAVFQMVELASADVSPDDLALSDECIVQEGATTDDLEMIDMDGPLSKAAKCYLACYYEKLGLIMHKKLDVDATIQMVKNYLNHDDPEELKITAEYLNECTDVTDEDRCDAAYKIGVCVREAAMSRGLIVDRRK